jgi:hypothetical protein
VHHGYVKDEALWSGSGRFDDLVAKVRLAWRMSDPVFKYLVPTAVSFGTNKTCSVVISDQQDMSVWFVGSGDPLNPKPFTAAITAFERGSQAKVLPLQETDYHVSLGYWATVNADVTSVLKPKIILRHSASDDVILFDRPDLNGLSFGGWGRAVLKARDAWRTRRPVFRYIDHCPLAGNEAIAGERVFVTIVDAEDFSQWMRFRQPLCQDLVVFDGAADDEFTPVQSQMMNEVGTPNQKRSEYEKTISAQCQAVRDMEESSKKTSRVVLSSRFTAGNLQPALDRGDYGPSFTTAASKLNSKKSNSGADRGAQQFEALVAKFSENPR